MKAFSALHPVDRLLPLSKVIAPYIMFDRQFVRFTVMSLRVDVFAPITRSRLLKDVIGSLSDPDGIGPEAYCKASRQDSSFCYITYPLSDLLHVIIGNNALYELGTNWSDLNKYQGPEHDDTIQMMFATLLNTIVRGLGAEIPKDTGHEVIDLEISIFFQLRVLSYSLLTQMNLATG